MTNDLKSMMGITLNTTISSVGLLPEEYKETVTRVVENARTDPAAMIALGCHLDECRRNQNYDSLGKFVVDYGER